MSGSLFLCVWLPILGDLCLGMVLDDSRQPKCTCIPAVIHHQLYRILLILAQPTNLSTDCELWTLWHNKLDFYGMTDCGPAHIHCRRSHIEYPSAVIKNKNKRKPVLNLKSYICIESVYTYLHGQSLPGQSHTIKVKDRICHKKYQADMAVYN